MIVLTDSAFIDCNHKQVTIKMNGITTKIELQTVNKISISTTDCGPFGDDMALAISVPDNVYLVKSQHPLYQKLLFDQLGKALTLDYQAIARSASSCQNAEFIVFSK